MSDVAHGPLVFFFFFFFKCKNRVPGRVIKNHLLKIHRGKKAQIYMKPSWYSADSSLIKSWFPGAGWDHNRENHFTYMCLCRKKYSKNLFQRNHWAKMFKFRWNLPDLIQSQVCNVLILGIYRYILKIFSRKTTEPKKFTFTWRVSDIVQIQVCSNYGPQGSDGVTIEKTFLHVLV